jgi:hypothetical protein
LYVVCSVQSAGLRSLRWDPLLGTGHIDATTVKVEVRMDFTLSKKLFERTAPGDRSFSSCYAQGCSISVVLEDGGTWVAGRENEGPRRLSLSAAHLELHGQKSSSHKFINLVLLQRLSVPCAYHAQRRHFLRAPTCSCPCRHDAC